LLFLAAGLFLALVALAADISAKWLEGLDITVAQRFAGHESHKSSVVADAVFGFIGQPAGVAVVAAVCGTLLSLRAGSPLPVVLLIGAVAAAVAVEQTLKTVVGRTVESVWLMNYVHSYPSGHVAGSAALLGTIAVLLGCGRRREVKAALATVVVICVLAVAFMALYVHAHLFSDVIGGMLLGGAVVSSGAAVLLASRNSSPAEAYIQR